MFGSDSTHMTACVAYMDLYSVCQTDYHARLTRDIYCPKSAREAKASLHHSQPWAATDGPITRSALRVWVNLTKDVIMAIGNWGRGSRHISGNFQGSRA